MEERPDVEAEGVIPFLIADLVEIVVGHLESSGGHQNVDAPESLDRLGDDGTTVRRI
jgi:hypothetical protein